MVQLKQSAKDFRDACAAYPKRPTDLVSQVLYGRGSLSKEVRREVVTMLKDLQIIVDVAGDPNGALVMRTNPEAEHG